ncbi:NYN domain-containing protein [Formicincola oecophyllae]|uniref:NYN domain-containing protein n=1 Tax=Formicincola oecophyllae TaxID=2558361 RepID=A0A4Y6U9L8_9PROT|nr:NYN domain-containing protein [Formicincola oecophyllae]QDH13248.1 NYN domain-containing protein [Formicincola oecophyllae]
MTSLAHGSLRNGLPPEPLDASSTEPDYPSDTTSPLSQDHVDEAAELAEWAEISKAPGRSVIMVDAGYLYAVAATWLSPEGNGSWAPTRRDIELNDKLTIERLKARVTSMFPCKELFRICWYDASPIYGNIVLPDHTRLAETDLVKLRLGRLAPDGRQKGVDVLLALDMSRHARDKAVTDIFLLSGDEDLLEAVREAQINGARVHLIGLVNAGRYQSVSTRMKRECDTYRDMSALGMVRSNQSWQPSQEAGSVQAPADEEGNAPAEPPPQKPLDAVKDTSSTQEGECGQSPQQNHEAAPEAGKDVTEGSDLETENTSLQTLQGKSCPTPEQLVAWRREVEKRRFDHAQRPSAAAMQIADAITSRAHELTAHRAIEELSRSLSQEELYEVRSLAPPSVPGRVDGRLLRHVSNCLKVDYLSDNDKRWVRDEFRFVTG